MAFWTISKCNKTSSFWLISAKLFLRQRHTCFTSKIRDILNIISSSVRRHFSPYFFSVPRQHFNPSYIFSVTRLHFSPSYTFSVTKTSFQSFMYLLSSSAATDTIQLPRPTFVSSCETFMSRANHRGGRQSHVRVIQDNAVCVFCTLESDHRRACL